MALFYGEKNILMQAAVFNGIIIALKTVANPKENK
jgi:hypothetical protein